MSSHGDLCDVLLYAHCVAASGSIGLWAGLVVRNVKKTPGGRWIWDWLLFVW